MKKKGFTLIELLVVIAIIAMLMAILMPALGRVRRLAQRLICGTNLKGLGTATMVYANDNRDEYPIAGGKGANSVASFGGQDDYWDKPEYDWSGADDVTISASLYLLVRDADVSPKQFVCQSSDQKEFTGSEADDYNGQRPDLTQLWDFGYSSSPGTETTVSEFPQKCVSYAYHLQHAYNNDPKYNFPLSSTSQAGMAVMADKNPWLDPALSASSAPAQDNFMNMVDRLNLNADPGSGKWGDIDTWKVQIANSAAHMREGQNILFNDGSVRFERRPDVGVQNDNIYTAQAGPGPNWTELQVRSGGNQAKVEDFPVKNRQDSVLVGDDKRP